MEKIYQSLNLEPNGETLTNFNALNISPNIAYYRKVSKIEWMIRLLKISGTFKLLTYEFEVLEANCTNQ